MTIKKEHDQASSACPLPTATAVLLVVLWDLPSVLDTPCMSAIKSKLRFRHLLHKLRSRQFSSKTIMLETQPLPI